MESIQQGKRVAENHRMECCSTHGRRKRGSSSQVHRHTEKKRKKKKNLMLYSAMCKPIVGGERERNGQAHRK